jgi:iron complex transport system substrate-binding protein
MESRNKIIAVVVIVIVISASIAGVLLLTKNEGEKKYSNISSVRLLICGNANEDDMIDERDVNFIQNVIDGSQTKSNLTDSNNDGVINQADIDQVRAIIDHKESKIYYVDVDGITCSVHFPVYTVAAIYTKYADVVRVLNATDRIVGIDDSIKTYKTYFPELQNLTSVGNRFTPNVETILKLNPDIYYTGTRSSYDSALEQKLAANGTDIDVVRLPSWEYGKTTQGVLTLAYILGQESEAYDYIVWFDSIVNMITQKVSSFSNDNKTTCLLDSIGNKARSTGSGDMEISEIAGANNIGKELSGGIYPVYDVEWVIEKNPNVIVSLVSAGYNYNDSALTDRLAIMDSQFSVTDAVKNDRVHIMAFDIANGVNLPIALCYYAKWFYPNLFTDLNPQDVHQHFIDTFLTGIDIDVSEHGGFAL